MATTFENFAPMRRWRPQAAGAATQPMVSDRAFRMLVMVMCMFGFRDMLTSSLRYYLSLVHLGAIWFIPDILTFVALGYFAWHIGWKNRSPYALLLVCSFFLSTLIGMVFMQSSPFAIFSSIKLFLPFFVGAAMVGRSVTDLSWAVKVMTALFVVSTIGLLISPHVEFAWTGQALDNFGQVKRVGKVWWSGEQMRYGGFAGESTMAAYMTLFPYILVHHKFPRLVNLLLWVPIYYALELSTSKTSQGIFVVFAIYYLYANFVSVPELSRLSRLAKWSFLTVPLPFVLMVLMAGVDLTTISPTLFSMQDRINNTWSFPFLWMAENLPTGLLTGCGLGCFTYPMEYTRLANLWVPVDNFYLATLAMMGVPFLVFVVGMFSAPFKSRHADKLLLILLLNLYAVTVQCYGPSTSTIFLAYAFSDMFLKGGNRWLRRRGVDARAAPTAA